MKIDFSQSACIILVGGAGTRFSKKNESPKQLIKIFKRTLLENIIIGFSKKNLNNFILPLGHKKNFFVNFFKKKKKILNKKVNFIYNPKSDLILKKKQINLVAFDSGTSVSKLTRIKKCLNILKSNYYFVTYGDGLANIDFNKYFNLINKTKKNFICSKKIRSQYGHLVCRNDNSINFFTEKPYMKDPINIGYYFFFRSTIENFYNKNHELEDQFLNKLIKKRLIKQFNHEGFFFNIDKKTDLLKLKAEKKNILKLL